LLFYFILYYLFLIQTLQKEGANKIVDIKPASEWPATGKIEFKGVQLRYREELPLVLNKVSFSVKAGEKIGKTEERISRQLYRILFFFLKDLFFYADYFLTMNYF